MTERVEYGPAVRRERVPARAQLLEQVPRAGCPGREGGEQGTGDRKARLAPHYLSRACRV